MRTGKSLKWLEDIEEDAMDLLIDHKEDISGSVYTRLKELNMSQSDLAEAMGVDRSQISRIIAAKQNLTLATLAKLEAALSIRFDSGFVYAPNKQAQGVGIQFTESFPKMQISHALTGAWYKQGRSSIVTERPKFEIVEKAA